MILGTLFIDPEIADIFSDERFLREMLSVEAALAVVQGRLGVIPAEAVGEIVPATSSLQVDYQLLQAGTEKAGVPTIELIRQLREGVGGPAADFVHWGATSQDIMDTALILQIRAALDIMESNLLNVIQNLARLADRYRHALMAGRTHSQQALPITFGFKVAGWLAPLRRHRQRLNELKARLLVLQFGGAAGTLASLEPLGMQVQEELAAELNLALPLTPWHTQRDNLAELAGWTSMVSGSLAKMAQDIILLAQSEVGEVRETVDRPRGGSSTTPQKSNPMLSEQIVAVARTNAGLLAAMHQALVQEHERATHGWQVEWLNLPQMFILSSAAIKKALFLSEHLVVDEERMRQNVKASNGLMLAEAISFALARFMSRAEAKELVSQSCRLAIEEDRHLVDVVVDVVGERTSAAIDWESLKDEEAYLGSAEAFIDRVLLAVEEDTGTGSRDAGIRETPP
jgi:3-carboxy-cis,cis-muconate cycloisomerase